MRKITVTIIAEAEIPDEAEILCSREGDPVSFKLGENTYAFWPIVEEQRSDETYRNLSDEQCEARGILLYEVTSHAFEERA